MPDGDSDGGGRSGRGPFTPGDVLATARLPRQTLHNWLEKKTLVLDPTFEDKEGGHGFPRQYSWHRLVQICLMVELVAYEGWTPTNAAYAALHFSDRGNMPERPPGELFPEGQTLLVAGRVPNANPPIFAKVIRVDTGTDWLHLLTALYLPTDDEPRRSFTTVHVNPIIARIQRTMEIRAR